MLLLHWTLFEIRKMWNSVKLGPYDFLHSIFHENFSFETFCLSPLIFLPKKIKIERLGVRSTLSHTFTPLSLSFAFFIISTFLANKLSLSLSLSQYRLQLHKISVILFSLFHSDVTPCLPLSLPVTHLGSPTSKPTLSHQCNTYILSLSLSLSHWNTSKLSLFLSLSPIISNTPLSAPITFCLSTLLFCWLILPLSFNFLTSTGEHQLKREVVSLYGLPPVWLV